MTNPYEPIAEVDDRFDFPSAIRMAIRFAGVGIITGAASGYQLDEAVARSSSSGMLMGGPGMTFGIGLVAAVVLFLPSVKQAAQFSWRRLRLCGVPVLMLIGFCMIGVAYDGIRPLAPVPMTSAGYARLWLLLAGGSIPGILVMGLGCRLVARPRSYPRFVVFLLVTAMLAGVAPIITVTCGWGFVESPFFLTMFVAQLTMFLMLGWIFGDCRHEPTAEETNASRIRHTRSSKLS